MIYTVSPVEKLTNRTTGTLPVRSRYGRGTAEVRSRYGQGTIEVRSRYGRGTVAVRQVLSRYVPGSLVVRYTQGSLLSIGTFLVRSLYGILKVRSHLVFSTRLEPGTRTVRFIVRIAQSRLAGFGPAIDTIPLVAMV